jgi:hypothetical protein
MITHITTAHEEQYSDGSRTLGVLLNYETNKNIEHNDFKDSLVYMFRQTENDGSRYVFFNTMFDLFSYMLYSENKMPMAYMDEDEFDSYYDAPYIEGSFRDKLKWVGLPEEEVSDKEK